MILIFYSKIPVSRVNYIVKQLFETILGLSVEFTHDEQYFLNSDKARIQYGNNGLNDSSFFIPCHSFIQETTIQKQNITIRNHENLPAFFWCAEEKADLPFDFFSMAFYLISRYEEYLPFEADQHGRFTAKSSLAHQQQFLKIPLIDLWLKRIVAKIKNRFNVDLTTSKKFQFVPTIDIDFAWAYKNKTTWRTMGGLTKDLLSLKIHSTKERLKIIAGEEADPYFSFDFLKSLHQQCNSNAIYFFLFGEHGPYDKNIHPSHPAMQDLVRRLATEAIIGIHPSYQSNNNNSQLLKEKEDLAKCSNQAIVVSRQHFLKLAFPKTYQNLLTIGIESDYTMGYAEAVGFRASTSHAFYWYDLTKEKETNLMVHPFQLMDVTLKNYLGLSPNKALEVCSEMIDAVKSVDGTLISIWHNSSFSKLMGWENWGPIYEQFLGMASEEKSPN